MFLIHHLIQNKSQSHYNGLLDLSQSSGSASPKPCISCYSPLLTLRQPQWLPCCSLSKLDMFYHRTILHQLFCLPRILFPPGICMDCSITSFRSLLRISPSQRDFPWLHYLKLQAPSPKNSLYPSSAFSPQHLLSFNILYILIIYLTYCCSPPPGCKLNKSTDFCVLFTALSPVLRTVTSTQQVLVMD